MPDRAIFQIPLLRLRRALHCRLSQSSAASESTMMTYHVEIHRHSLHLYGYWSGADFIAASDVCSLISTSRSVSGETPNGR
jgi:hypothetical protein